MECKLRTSDNDPGRCCSINRNIVECKYVSTLLSFGLYAVLIETLWNVNFYRHSSQWLQSLVLIETLWNVNREEKENEKVEKVVLIETLWNVNEGQSACSKSSRSINRNIVECKSD